MFDAYTVKKILPRLVIAVIFIQLSWFIFTGMIALTTAVAYGVEGLIYAPFGSREEFSLAEILSSVTGGGNGIFLAIMIAGAGTLGLLGGALTMALGAVLSIMIGFIMLLLRQVMIVALLLISPLAIVAWILPNTEKFWKLWWENFSKLLLVFPMIVGVVAVGRVFAYITAGVDPGGSAENLATDFGIDELVTVFFIIIGFFGPFFLIPKLFALAGSAFASANNLVNNRAQGAFGFLGKKRAARQAERGKAFLGGNMNERSFIGRRINRVGAGLGAGYKGNFGIGSKGKEAVLQKRQALNEEVAKSNHQLQQLGLNNDDGIALLGLSGGNREGFNEASAQLQKHWYEQRREENIKKGMAAVDAETEAKAHSKARIERAQSASKAVGVTKANASAAFNLMAQNKARAIGEGRNDLIQAGADRLGGGNKQASDEAKGGFQYHARGAGRYDLGADTATKGWQKGSLYTLANSQPASIAGVGKEMVAGMTAGPEGLEKAAIFHQELQAMLPSATGDARDTIIKQQAALEEANGGALVTYLNSAVPDPTSPTGTAQVRERVAYDASNPAHASWTPEEINIGSRIETRDQTNADLARAQARTYQRPDENNL